MRKKILIIDDDATIGSVIIEYLTDNGYSVHHALSGAQALEMMEKDKPDLVLLDYMMPVMNGLDVLKEIGIRFPNVVVLMLTGAEEMSIAKRAIRLGACGYVTKPINLELLLKDYINRVMV